MTAGADFPFRLPLVRSAVQWTQADLAEAATLGSATIKNFENERRETTAANLKAIQRALENAGVELIAPKGGKGAGVRLAMES